MYYIDIEGLSIPMVGLGTFSMHGEELKAVMASALEMGYRLFDTAYRYGNEDEIGGIVSGLDSARPVVLSTKLSGLQFNGRRKRLYLDRQSPRRSLAGSLRRLRQKSIDIYMLHSPFRDYHKAYAKLLKEKERGRVKVLGVSGYGIDHLKRIKDYCGEYPMVDMVELHPYHSSRAVVDFCKENNIRLIARSPFAHGEIIPLLSEDADIRNMANAFNKSIPQIILRWIVQQGVIAMPRTKNPNHLQENIDVFDFELSNSDMDVIDMKNKDLSFGVVAGKR